MEPAGCELVPEFLDVGEISDISFGHDSFSAAFNKSEPGPYHITPAVSEQDHFGISYCSGRIAVDD